jgi:TDG/mug DNA glycosylase family protein
MVISVSGNGECCCEGRGLEVNIRQKRSAAKSDWAARRLSDRIAAGVRVLFVGINPGVRSAITGHHFAGPSNRFWKLLHESRLVPERIGFEEDGRLPEWGYGITNLVPRPSPGIDDLRPSDYVAGWKVLERKVEVHRPQVLALVGVTLFRAILPIVRPEPRPRRPGPVLRLGAQAVTVHGARVFVLPNPSGRNANFTYAEMLAAFRGLKRYLTRTEAACRS